MAIDPPSPRLRIAVVGSGISGLSAAWLLSSRHEVVVYEAEGRAGGHSHTVEAPSPSGPVSVDTGFIVYNEVNYPNLTALFAHLDVATKPTQMSFAVSLDDGALEYSSTGLGGLFGQVENLGRGRFWAMLADMRRFHREAPRDLDALIASGESLDDYLARGGYGRMFRDAHLAPQAAAIWSSGVTEIGQFPAASLVRFYMNHDLLGLVSRIGWRTVEGGSRSYVRRLTSTLGSDVRLSRAVSAIHREPHQVLIRDVTGEVDRFDAVLVATHSDQALALLEHPTADERRLLSAIGYTRNHAVLHRDRRLAPRRRQCWAAWNHIGRSDGASSVTYWMNRLQGLPGPDLFVTLNPIHEPEPGLVIRSDVYEHPVFNAAAMAAQAELWSLQGVNRTWFAGAYFGSGFHEDGLQAGLAAAEDLGGVQRPWTVAEPNGRISVRPRTARAAEAA